jgi:uroporphyrinogen decarboxylase
MTSYERLLNAVTGGTPDRIPVAPEIFGVSARLNGRRISEYVRDSGVIADSQLRLRKEIGYDILFAFADLSVEAEALGCGLQYEEDAYPSVEERILKNANEAGEFIAGRGLPDPSKDGRMPVVLDACRILRESVKDECVIAACVMGPVSIAAQIMGIENLLYQLVDNPDGVSKILDFTEKTAIIYGNALMKAGAHCPVIFDPVASPAVIPPSLFVHYEAPRLARMYEAFRLAGSPVSWISIAGATQKIMPYFKKTGINLATIDYVVSVEEAFKIAGDIALNGNLKPYSFISFTPEQMKDEAKKCIKEAAGRKNYIIGSGCEVPVESRAENIIALVEAVKGLGRNRSKKSVTVELNSIEGPLKRSITLERGGNLLDAFLAGGIEIPVLCNQNGSCGKCRVIVRAEANPVTDVERLSLGESLIREGYRLACRTELFGDGEVSIPSESSEEFIETVYSGSEVNVIQNMESQYPLSNDCGGFSAAIDIGTTTLTGYLFDQNRLLSHCSFFNPTALYGCDVITRLATVQNNDESFQKMRRSLLEGVNRLLHTLCFRALEGDADAGIGRIRRVAVCGNTIMQHMFIGVNPVEIGIFPYKPIVKDILKIGAEELMDGFKGGAEIIVAPSVSGFVGGDAVCGILALQMHKPGEPHLMIDLGTNGEMALAYNGELFAASASAGPAFEGYRITSGMRATIGAIDSVRINGNNEVSFSVIGGAGIRPKGICGTGVISAAASMIEAGILTEKGHIVPGAGAERIKSNSFVIAAKEETATGKPIMLCDRDIEVIQKAKAAFAAGISCLCRSAGIAPENLKKISVAGAFGSRVDAEDLKTIGLIPYGINADISSAGNAAGLGAVTMLLSKDAEREASGIAQRVKTIELASMKEFEDEFIEALYFRNHVCR